MSIRVAFLSVLVLVAGCFAQAPAASPAQDLTEIVRGILIPAELSKSLDAKKTKPGDKIEAKTTMDMLSQGQIVIPRNSKIEGHITTAKPKSKESPESELGIAFDRIVMKNGRELPMHAALQAIAPPLIIGVDAPGTPAAIGSAPPGQEAGNEGISESPGTALTGAGQIPSMPTSSTSTPARPGAALTSSSHGAVGMKGAALNSNKDTNVITSSRQTVHLDAGTQLMLQTE